MCTSSICLDSLTIIIRPSSRVQDLEELVLALDEASSCLRDLREVRSQKPDRLGSRIWRHSDRASHTLGVVLEEKVTRLRGWGLQWRCSCSQGTSSRLLLGARRHWWLVPRLSLVFLWAGTDIYLWEGELALWWCGSCIPPLRAASYRLHRLLLQISWLGCPQGRSDALQWCSTLALLLAAFPHTALLHAYPLGAADRVAHWLLLNAQIDIEHIHVEVKHVLHCSELINLLFLESDD